MKGLCLCGAIEVDAPNHHEINVCHCSTCRQWSSGPMFTVHCGQNVEFNGTTPKTYRSSDWAERGFCSTCGTHLFYHLLATDEYILTAGIFQNVAAFDITQQIFIDEKPPYYDLSNQTPVMTGEEVFALFADDNV